MEIKFQCKDKLIWMVFIGYIFMSDSLHLGHGAQHIDIMLNQKLLIKRCKHMWKPDKILGLVQS